MSRREREEEAGQRAVICPDSCTTTLPLAHHGAARPCGAFCRRRRLQRSWQSNAVRTRDANPGGSGDEGGHVSLLSHSKQPGPARLCLPQPVPSPSVHPWAPFRNPLVFHANGHPHGSWCLARPVLSATSQFLGQMDTLKNPDSYAVFASKNPHLRATADFLK